MLLVVAVHERVTRLRQGDQASRVSNVELFFDLVYVFAVTQLSHLLLEDPSVAGALRTAVVLAMVWQAWVYTTWSVNYLDPARTSVRTMLLVVMALSLVMASAIPSVYDRDDATAGLFAGAYVAIQFGRALFEVWALRGERLQMVYLRLLPWATLTSTVFVLGALVDGATARAALWAVAVATDLFAASIGFRVPGLGRSATTDWTISGEHFAERCQAFVLIALGESVVVIGSRVHLHHAATSDLAAAALAFAGTVALWWIYFDSSAESSSREIATSADPGRLARNAFHFVHPLIIGGVIVVAAADEGLLAAPRAHLHGAGAWLGLGGTALFLAGHAIFKAVVWRVVSWQRVVGAAVLLVLLPVAPHVSALTVAVAVVVVVVAVAAADRLQHPHRATHTA